MTSQRILLQDALAKESAYRGLSAQAVESGNTWLAVHAQAASDTAYTRSFCLQSGVPVTSIEEAGDYLSAGEWGEVSCQEASTLFRGALALALPEWAADQWAHHLPGNTHLPAEQGPDITIMRDTIMDRFAGDEPGTYLARREEDRLAAVEDYVAAMSEGEQWNAVAAAFAADTAAFEMWLLERSLQNNDPYLTHYEMLWRLASNAIEQLTQLPDDPQAAVFVLRSRAAWTVGPLEAPSLKNVFHDL